MDFIRERPPPEPPLLKTPPPPEPPPPKPQTTFDFMTSPVDGDAPDAPEYVGPNLKGAVKMTPRKFAQSVLEVFDKLGGTSWLFTQAIADPKAFLGLLSKMIPKSVQLDDLAGFTVNIIDQFGKGIALTPNTNSNSATGCSNEDSLQGHQESGQLLIATSGNPAPLEGTSSTLKGEPPPPTPQEDDLLKDSYVIKDKF